MFKRKARRVLLAFGVKQTSSVARHRRATIGLVLLPLVASCGSVTRPDYVTRQGMRVYLHDGAETEPYEVEEVIDRVEAEVLRVRDYSRKWLQRGYKNAKLHLQPGVVREHCKTTKGCYGTYHPPTTTLRVQILDRDCIAVSALGHEIGHLIRDYGQYDYDPSHDDAELWAAVGEANFQVCELLCSLCQGPQAGTETALASAPCMSPGSLSTRDEP